MISKIWISQLQFRVLDVLKQKMKAPVFTMIVVALAFLSACEKAPPPRSTADFMEDPILLEATMVTCFRDRSRMKYERECVNAREAVNRLASVEEADRQQELDRQSERKRQALRQAQMAASEARERASEADRLREEAEYLGQFEVLAEEGAAELPVAGETAVVADDLAGNQPGIVMPEPDSGSAVQIELPAPADPADSDLEAVRQQLNERQEPPSDG